MRGPPQLPDPAALLLEPAALPVLAAAMEAAHLPFERRAGALGGLGPPALVRAALIQADLRQRARAKMPFADRLLLTRTALEQATPWPVAVERAARWPLPASARVVDLGAGLGLDALAFACAGRPVTAVERDPLLAELLRRNAAALGVADGLHVREGDARTLEIEAVGAFLDPDRRPAGRRTRDVAAFEPPAGAWPALLAGRAVAMVKVGPVLARGLPTDVPMEVVSLDGEVRERRLLHAGFAGAPPLRALALPSGASIEGPGAPWPAPRAPAAGAWVLDPDPAVTVAGLVGDLCLRDGLAPIHPQIAYLLAEAPVPRAPGTWLAIDAVLPPDARALDAWLAAHDVGRVEIRCRGVSDGAPAWRRRLHPRGAGAATLLFTRGPDDRWVALASLRSA